MFGEWTKSDALLSPQNTRECTQNASESIFFLKVTLTMLSRVIEAKDHPEYSEIDQLTTTIGQVALGGEKPQDAQELSFQDQLRLLTLVFEYSRDKVVYKGETFGEHVRWTTRLSIPR